MQKDVLYCVAGLNPFKDVKIGKFGKVKGKNELIKLLAVVGGGGEQSRRNGETFIIGSLWFGLLTE